MVKRSLQTFVHYVLQWRCAVRQVVGVRAWLVEDANARLRRRGNTLTHSSKDISPSTHNIRIVTCQPQLANALHVLQYVFENMLLHIIIAGMPDSKPVGAQNRGLGRCFVFGKYVVSISTSTAYASYGVFERPDNGICIIASCRSRPQRTTSQHGMVACLNGRSHKMQSAYSWYSCCTFTHTHPALIMVQLIHYSQKPDKSMFLLQAYGSLPCAALDHLDFEFIVQNIRDILPDPTGNLVLGNRHNHL